MTNGYEFLVDGLRSLGVTLYAGVNGGGVIHLANLLNPVRDTRNPPAGTPRMFTVPEYVAGYVPLGHYIATGRPAACLTTTGAATKLAASGLSDAKLHNIPAVYIAALNATTTYGRSPLQDVSDEGANMAAQLEAELGSAFLHVEDLKDLPRQFTALRDHLRASRPVALAFHPDLLHEAPPIGPVEAEPVEDLPAGDDLAGRFRSEAAGRRVVILVTDEAARSSDMPALTTDLAEALGAPVVWTVNGAAGTEAINPFGYGHIGFGGNDAATALWSSLGERDVLLTLGFEPGEYILNLADIPAGHVFHLTDQPTPYGHRDGGFAHRCRGRYHRFTGPLPSAVRSLLPTRGTLRQPYAPADLNIERATDSLLPGRVDFAEFLRRTHNAWRRPAIGFDDVSTAYKDRQYVTQRPHPLMRAFSAYQGSAMGGAFGMALGAKLAAPDRTVACFTGDGCFRFFAGALADTAELGLRLFVVNNASYAIVEQGLRHILAPGGHHHSALAPLNHVPVAHAMGWDGVRVDADLANLDDIMELCQSDSTRSLLIEVPVDPAQELGPNPRLRNLLGRTYL